MIFERVMSGHYKKIINYFVLGNIGLNPPSAFLSDGKFGVLGLGRSAGGKLDRSVVGSWVVVRGWAEPRLGAVMERRA